ncbi:DNA-binding protein [Pseudomonas antarctica]|uniref:DNA-binding protein n=1 Tax=Pseudomonas antarctica TaxID=219572 RepID=A0A172Z4Q1_9PSED|nr:hypothetical protein [Pseudomonas antarctica]ANF87464.1 DNA-binding protein [Pseudomonas antarctica]
MEAVMGTIKSYCRKTGEGVIALDDGDEPVRVDLKSTAGIWLEKGQRVKFARIHRPAGIFATSIKII